jgi:hypothetical protein
MKTYKLPISKIKSYILCPEGKIALKEYLSNYQKKYPRRKYLYFTINEFYSQLRRYRKLSAESRYLFNIEAHSLLEALVGRKIPFSRFISIGEYKRTINLDRVITKYLERS